MTDDLIARLASDLRPIPSRALERRLVLALVLGLIVTLAGGYVLFAMLMGRPFGAAFGGPMFWVKFAYTLGIGALAAAAAPTLSRPDGQKLWPLAAIGALILLALISGVLVWSGTQWSMPELMGATAMVCPWLITLSGAPILVAMIMAMRRFAPHSPTLAGVAAGLVAGGLGAWAYAFYCGETGMMFMAVWYTLGIAMTALLGAIMGRVLLRW